MGRATVPGSCREVIAMRGRELTPEEEEELYRLVDISNDRDLTAEERRRYCELHGFSEEATEYIAANGWPRE